MFQGKLRNFLSQILKIKEEILKFQMEKCVGKEGNVPDLDREIESPSKIGRHITCMQKCCLIRNTSCRYFQGPFLIKTLKQ